MALSIRAGRWVRADHVVEIPINESEFDIHFQPVVFDLFQVLKWEKSYEEEGVPQLFTDVLLRTGEMVCIDADFTDFDALMEKYVMKSSTRYYFPN